MTGIPFFDVIAQQAARQVQIVNESLRIANESKSIATRESRLALARRIVAELQALAAQHTFLSLTNLAGILRNIEEIAAEIETAKNAAANAPPRRRRQRAAIGDLAGDGPLALINLRDVSLTVVDLETTGLSPSAGARIVELSVVRVDPGREPRVVLDTLINPQGPVYCTEIHGISDDDVVGAPVFADVVGDLVASLEGTLVAAYNSSFDMSFLREEIGTSGARELRAPPPHVCLMWLRPLLGVGKRCALKVACDEHGIAPGGHKASGDALASAQLWSRYVTAAEQRGIKTLGDLVRAGSHKYLTTLRYPFYGSADLAEAGGRRPHLRLKPRSGQADPSNGVREYWHALVASLVDGMLDDSELAGLKTIQAAYSLSEPEKRAVHARLFADKLRAAAEDDALLDDEVAALSALKGQLATLGWAP